MYTYKMTNYIPASTASSALVSLPSLEYLEAQATPRGANTVQESQRFYPLYPQYLPYQQPQVQQYVPQQQQYVPEVQQYVPWLPQYGLQPLQQFPQFSQPRYYELQYLQPQYPYGSYCETHYVSPQVVSKSNSSHSSPISALSRHSQPPQTSQESLSVSM